MKLWLSQLAASSIFWCPWSAAASTSRPGNPETSGRPGGPKDPIRGLELRPLDRKTSIRALVGDERLKINGPSMRRHIAALHKSFFDVLISSKLYLLLDEQSEATRPGTASRKRGPRLEKSAEARILMMSPRCFRKRYEGWRQRRVLHYESRVKECSAERKALELRGMEHPLDEKKALAALRSSLKESDKRRDKSIAKLARLKRCCEKIESLSCKMIGENSIFALYRSYLADQRGLEMGRDEDPGSNESPAPNGHRDCMVCLDPLGRGAETIGCANGHSSHAACLYEWRRHGNGTCPVCRGAFTEEQENRLAEYETRYTDYFSGLCSDLDYLCNPDDDLDFEEKYTHADGGPDERHLFMLMCLELRTRISNLKSHPDYAAIFCSPGCSAHRRFCIPQNVLSYFESTRMGYHDPRSKGFGKHKAVLVKHVHDFLKENRAILECGISHPIHFALNAFCALDSLLEYLYTELREIADPAEKRQAVVSDPQAYAALNSSISRNPGLSLDQIHHAVAQFAWGTGLPPVFYSQQWLLKASEVFSQMVSEV